LKIIVDSNVLLSALFYPNSKPAKALCHVVENHELILSDHIISEVHRIAAEKFAHKQGDVGLFFDELTYELVGEHESADVLINDPKDVPILNAAIADGVDIIISGDGHFYKLDLERPKTMKAAEYLESVEAEE